MTGTLVYIEVEVSQPGRLNVFADHNNDGVFQTDGNPISVSPAELAQHILKDYIVVAGVNVIQLDLTTVAAGINPTLFRIIYSDISGVTSAAGPDFDYSGTLQGEIEDYSATLIQQDVHATITAETGDAVSISRVGSDFVVANYFIAPIGALDGGVTLIGTPADEDYDFDFSGGMPIPSGGLDLQPGAGNDELSISGTPAGRTWVSVTHDYALGQVVMTDDLAASYTMSFTDLELLTDNLASTSKVFQGTGAADLIDIDQGTLAADGYTAFGITGNILSSVFVDPTGSVVVNAGADDDVITVSDFDDSTPFTGSFIVNGDAGDDELVIEWADGHVPNLTFNGGAHVGGDVITLQNTAGPVPDEINYVAATANDGTISVETGATASLITYTGLEPIFDLIPTALKTFTYAATDDDIDLDVDGGAGVGRDLITAPGTAESVDFTTTGLLNVEIYGGLGDDTFNIEPSSVYNIYADGQNEPVADVIDIDIASLGGPVVISLNETGLESGVYSFSTMATTVTYEEMEQVGMRFSDPNAFPLATYPGDIMYPLNTESGISIEPYFNWDIDNWPVTSPISTLTLNLDDDADLLSPFYVRPVFTGDPGITGDYLITDVDDPFDSANGIPLMNSTKYYWNLAADLGGGVVFTGITEFTTVDALMPALNNPKDRTLADIVSFDFSWDVGAAVGNSVYWRLDVDMNPVVSFDGATPAVIGGDIENDDNTDLVDGYATQTMFAASDLPTPILYGSDYSWRVSSMWPVPPTGWVPQEIFDLNETDRMMSVSTVVGFSTANLTVTPIQSYPIAGADVFVNDPVLAWYTGTPFNDLTFDVEVYEDDGTGNPLGPVVCSAAGLTGLQFDTALYCTNSNLVPGLDPGVGYVWRVKSNVGLQSSAWSGYEAFTTQGVGTNVKVTPSYPIGDLEIYTTAPEVHWFTATKFGGLDYTVHYLDLTEPVVIGTPASCAALKGNPNALSLPTVSVPQSQLTGLEPGHNYAWCVTSSNGISPDIDSDVATFSVAGGSADAIPVASWPVGNPTIYSTTQQLNWYLDGSALGVDDYDVQYCADAAYTISCTTISGITNTNTILTGLAYGQQVYWRVQANYTGGDFSDWTNVRSQGSFNVTGVLSSITAVPTFPVGGKLLADNDVTLSWYVSGATNVPLTFRVQYSYTELFLNVGTVTTTTITTDPFLDVQDLIPGHTYWWRVAISNDGGATYGAYSAVESFVIAAGAVAVQPQVGSPNNGVRLSTASPTLSWILPVAPGEGGQTYELLLSTSPDMSNATTFSGISDPYLQMDNLAPGTYFWQVRSLSDGGNSAYSGVGVFTSASLSTDIDEPMADVLPNDFALGQNYPNPFNPTTSIEYNVADAANVSIRIYNVLGQQVRTLVNGQMSPGRYTVQWDARDEAGQSMPSGLYIYRMEAGSFSQTRSLVLMK